MGLIELINKLGQSTPSKRPQIYKQIANVIPEKDSSKEERNVSKVESESFFNQVMADLKDGNNDLRQVVITTIPAVLNSNSPKVFTKGQRLDVIKYVISLINADEEPSIVIKCLWCLNQLPNFKYDDEMIKDILHGFDAVISVRSKAFVLYFEVCCFFQRLYKEYESSVKKFIPIVMKLVFLPLSHPTSKIREIAESSLNLIFPAFLTSQKEIVIVVKKLTKENYLKDLLFLFNQKQEIYVLKVWSRLVTAVGKGLHDGCSLINALLEIVERAFKSSQEDVSIAAFAAWKSLISNYALDNRVLGNQKKLKLLLQPFKRNANFNKNILAAVCDAWWFLIWNLNNILGNNFELVCVPFLEFTLRKRLKGTPNLPLAAHKPGTDSEAFLLKTGCEALLRLLEQPSSPNFNHLASPKKMPPLPFAQLQVPILPSILVKHFESILVLSKTIISAIGNDGKMSNNIDCLMKSILSVVATMPEDCSKESVSVITSYINLVSETVYQKLCPPLLCLKSIESITKLPRKILVSHLYCLGNIKKIQDNLCSALLSLMLDPYILSASNSTPRYFSTYNRVVQAGIHGALNPLDIVQYFINAITKPTVIDNCDDDGLLNLWMGIAAPFLEAIEKTQEVNQGDNIEHDFSCVCDVLMYPIDLIILRNKYPFHSKPAFNLWTNLYKTCNRCSSLVVSADANTLCEEFCSKFRNSIKLELIQVPEVFESYSQMIEAIVVVVDYSSCSVINKLGNNSKLFSKQQKKSIGNLTSLVHLIVQLLEVYYLKMMNTDSNKEKQQSDSTWVSLKLMSPLELMKTFFSNIASSSIIPPTLKKIAEPLSKYYLITDKNKLTSSFVCKLDALWNNMTTTIQLHYGGPYDTEFLNVITPLLESTFSHSRRTIRERSRKFWFKTFGLSLPTLKFPQNLKNILKKMKLPLLPEMEISPTEEISILPSSESFPENEAAYNATLSFNVNGMKLTENKKVTVFSSPKSSILSTPKSKRKADSKFNIDDLPDEEFVKIESPVSSPATNRRGSKRKKSYVPALYNDLSQNGDTFENSTESQNTISNSLPEDCSKNLKNEKSLEECLNPSADIVPNSEKDDAPHLPMPENNSVEEPLVTLSSVEDCVKETSSLILAEKAASKNIQDNPKKSLDCPRNDKIQKLKEKEINNESECNLKNLEGPNEKGNVDSCEPEIPTSIQESKSTVEKVDTVVKDSDQKEEPKSETHNEVEIIYESEKAFDCNSIDLLSDIKPQHNVALKLKPNADSKLESSFSKSVRKSRQSQRKSEPVTQSAIMDLFEKSIFRNLNKSSSDVILIEDSEEIIPSSQSSCGKESTFNISRKSYCPTEPVHSERSSTLSSRSADEIEVFDELQNKENSTLKKDGSDQSGTISHVSAMDNFTTDISKRDELDKHSDICTSSATDIQLCTKDTAMMEDEKVLPNFAEPENKDIFSLLDSIVEGVVKEIGQSSSEALNIENKKNTVDNHQQDEQIDNNVTELITAFSESDSSQNSSQGSEKGKSKTNKMSNTSQSKFFKESRLLRSNKSKRLTRNSLGISTVSKGKVSHKRSSLEKSSAVSNSSELPSSTKNVSESLKSPKAESSDRDLLKPNIDVSKKSKKETKNTKKNSVETVNSVFKHEELNLVTFIKIEIDSSRKDNSPISKTESEKNAKIKRGILSSKSDDKSLSSKSNKSQTKASPLATSVFQRRSPRKHKLSPQCSLKGKAMTNLAKDLFGDTPTSACEIVKVKLGRVSSPSSLKPSRSKNVIELGAKRRKARVSLPVTTSKCKVEDKISLLSEINKVRQFVKKSDPKTNDKNVSISKPIEPLENENVSSQDKDVVVDLKISSAGSEIANPLNSSLNCKQEVIDEIVPNLGALDNECSQSVHTVPDTLQEELLFTTSDDNYGNEAVSKLFLSEVPVNKEPETDVFLDQSNLKSDADVVVDAISDSKITKSKRGRKSKSKTILKLVTDSVQATNEKNLQTTENENIAGPLPRAAENENVVIENTAHIEPSAPSDASSDNSDVFDKSKLHKTSESKVLAVTTFESSTSTDSASPLPKNTKSRRKTLPKSQLTLFKMNTRSRNGTNSHKNEECVIDCDVSRQSYSTTTDKIMVIQSSIDSEPNAVSDIVENQSEEIIVNKDSTSNEHFSVEETKADEKVNLSTSQDDQEQKIQPVSDVLEMIFRDVMINLAECQANTEIKTDEKINLNTSEDQKQNNTPDNQEKTIQPVSDVSEMISRDMMGQANTQTMQEFNSNSESTISKNTNKTIPEILNSVLQSIDSKLEFPQFAFSSVSEVDCSQSDSFSFNLNSGRSFEIPMEEGEIETEKSKVSETDDQDDEASQAVEQKNKIAEIEEKTVVSVIEEPCTVSVGFEEPADLDIVNKVVAIEPDKAISNVSQDTNLGTEKESIVIGTALHEADTMLEQNTDLNDKKGDIAIESIQADEGSEIEQIEMDKVKEQNKVIVVEDIEVRDQIFVAEVCPENGTIETDNESVIYDKVQTINDEKSVANVEIIYLKSSETMEPNDAEITDSSCMAQSEVLFSSSENSIDDKIDAHTENKIPEELSKPVADETVSAEYISETVETESDKNSSDKKHIIDHLYASQNPSNNKFSTSQVDTKKEESLDSESCDKNVMEIKETNSVSDVCESSSGSTAGLSIHSKPSEIIECVTPETKSISNQEKTLETEDVLNNPFILDSMEGNKMLAQKSVCSELSPKSNLALNQSKIASENKEHQQNEEFISSENNTCLDFETNGTSQMLHASDADCVPSTLKQCTERESGVIIHNNDPVTKPDAIASEDILEEQEISTAPLKLNALEDIDCAELEICTGIEYQESESDIITLKDHDSTKPVLANDEESDNVVQTSKLVNTSQDETDIEIKTGMVSIAHESSELTSKACQESNKLIQNDAGKESECERSDIEDNVFVNLETDAVKTSLCDARESHVVESSSKSDESSSQDIDTGSGSQKRKAKVPVRSPVLLRQRKSGVILSTRPINKKQNHVCPHDNKEKIKHVQRNVSLENSSSSQSNGSNQDLSLSNGFCSETGENEVEKDFPSVSNTISMKMSPLSRSYKIVQAVRLRETVTSENVQSKDAASKGITLGVELKHTEQRESPAIVYPDSPVSTPRRSAIKKRNLDADCFSALSKRQKVSFADPLVEERVFTVADGKELYSTKSLVSCLKGSKRSRKRIFTSCESPMSKSEPAAKLTKEKCNSAEGKDVLEEKCSQCESNQSEVISQGFNASADKDLPSSSEYMDSETLPYESSVRKSPICSALVDCKHSVFNITGDLTSSTWVKGLNKLLTKMKILTIGDLCKMSVEEVKAMPIKSPKVENVHNAICSYVKQNQIEALNASKCLGSNESSTNILQCDETISTESELGFDDEEIKGLPETETIEERKEKMMEELLKCKNFDDIPVQILAEIAKKCIDSLTCRTANS